MPDDKMKRGGEDRARVASGQQYQVAYFAKKHGLLAAAAREILVVAGTSRRRADALAELGKGGQRKTR